MAVSARRADSKVSNAQVQGTNDFNTASKCSMVKAGYFGDNFVSEFVKKYNRRTPVIHLGYYVRMFCVDLVLRSFVESTIRKQLQVISLGAGFDTTFFRFVDNDLLNFNVVFFELDFEEVVERKLMTILGSKPLMDCIGPFRVNPDGLKGLTGHQYKLFAADLNDLEKLESALKAAGANFSYPTLLFAECSICYMERERADRLIKWAASRFREATFAVYEQAYPDDGFGTVMCKHFENMNSPLLSVKKYSTIEAQKRRYISHGWEKCKAWTAIHVFKQSHLYEQTRIHEPCVEFLKTEPFDEFEEWILQGNHFFLLLATKGISRSHWFKMMVPNVEFAVPEIRYKEVDWEVIPSEACRFAHQTVKIQQGDHNIILMIGGFGPSSNSTHGRRKEVLALQIRPYAEDNVISHTVVIKEVPTETEAKLNALHHRCVLLQERKGCKRIFIYGGRYSPSKPVNERPHIMKINQSGEGITLSDVQCQMEDNFPEPRFRHSMVCFNSEGKDHVVVFGGRTTDLKVLRSLLIWTVEGEKITWCETDRKADGKCWPTARFGHSAVIWREVFMIVTGGLGVDLTPCRNPMIYEIESGSWIELKVQGGIPHRFGHTSAIYGDKLILVGGVWDNQGGPPGVTVVELMRALASEYSLPGQDPEYPIMLHNHTSEVMGGELLTFGGGGNCFSFGTAFNRHVIRLPLNQLILRPAMEI